MGKLLTNIAVGAIAFGLSAVAGEVVLRTVVTLPLPRVLPEVRYAPHPVRRFTLLPDQVAHSYGAPVRIDGRAFRVDGSEPPAPHATLFALGDSFTFGLGVKDDETWPAQLERLLRRDAASGIDVVNGGTIGYGVFQELDLLKGSGLALQPTIVVHGLHWNDFMSASAPEPGARPVVDSDGYLIWDRLGEKGLARLAGTTVPSSAFLFTVRQLVGELRETARPQTGYSAAYAKFLSEGLAADEWMTIETFYRELQTLARAHKFELVVMIMPVIDIVTSQHPEQHPFVTEARRRLTQLGITYVDGFTVTQTAAAFLPQGRDAHLNAGGYRGLAEAAVPVVRQRTSSPTQ